MHSFEDLNSNDKDLDIGHTVWRTVA